MTRFIEPTPLIHLTLAYRPVSMDGYSACSGSLLVEPTGYMEAFMSFGIYLLGYLILIVGLGVGANMLNVPLEWIGVGVLCLVGIAIIHGVTSTRQKDTAA